MPSADSLLDAVRSAYARIGDVEAVVRSHPGDRMVMASLRSLQAHAEQLVGSARVRRLKELLAKIEPPPAPAVPLPPATRWVNSAIGRKKRRR